MRYINKKAQGALEFLMTYGWAFLVILIMIGALAYFGVLNPTKFLPDRCNFGAELNCKKGEFVVKADIANTILAKMTNQFGATIKIFNVQVITDITDGLGGCQPYLKNSQGVRKIAGDDKPVVPAVATKEEVSNSGSVLWKDGETIELNIDCMGAETALVVGDKIKLGVEFKWYPASSTVSFAKTMSGELFTGVQAK